MQDNRPINSYFCTEFKEIYQLLQTMGNFCSEETARTKMINFKRFLYNMPRNHHDRNTRFFYDYPNVPPIMYYIYCRMCLFVSNTNITYINNKFPKTDFKQDFINYAFKIPMRFLPVLLAFILAYQDNLSEKASVHKFFSKMDSCISRFPIEQFQKYDSNYNTELLLQDAQEQMNLILGKDYFLLLEEIFFTYSDNPLQRHILQKATLPLTERFTFEILFSKKDPTTCLNLLKYFERKLSDVSEFFEKSNETTNHQYLYKNMIPCALDDERDLLKTIHQEIWNTQQQIAREIQFFLLANHSENQTYKLSVIEYSAFSKFIEGQRKLLQTKHSIITQRFYGYYNHLSCLPMGDEIYDYFKNEFGYVHINEAKENIVFERSNIAYKLSKFVDYYDKAYAKSSKMLDQLLHCVKKMSGKQVDRYDFETIQEHDNFDITKEFDYIYSKIPYKEMEEMISIYPSYYQKTSSFVEAIAYTYEQLDRILKDNNI